MLRCIFSLRSFLFLIKGPRLIGAAKSSSSWEARFLWLPRCRLSQRWGHAHNTFTLMHAIHVQYMWIHMDRNTQHSRDYKQHQWFLFHSTVLVSRMKVQQWAKYTTEQCWSFQEAAYLLPFSSVLIRHIYFNLLNPRFVYCCSLQSLMTFF